MIGFRRTDTGILANWWWTVDRWLLFGMLALIGLGYIMAFASSPAIAHRLDMATYHFAYRQIIFLSAAFVIALGLSLCTPLLLRRLAFLFGIIALIGMGATILTGDIINGARRWLYIGGFSVQFSEFLKPCFVVAIAWCFTMQNTRFNMQGHIWAFALLLLAVGLLALQPDIGQSVLLALVWAGLFFLSGGSYAIIALLALVGLVVGLATYHHFDHVKNRVDRFLDPSSGDTYQADRALEAVQNGGLWGVGLGDGQVKHRLPDAHTDYVFAVATEEGGMLFGLLIIALFALLVLRVLYNLQSENRHWIQLSAAGLAGLLAVQSIINFAVNLNLVPSKGMTLPFISYGGSSLLGLSLTMGMILSLTRKRRGQKSFGPVSIREIQHIELPSEIARPLMRGHDLGRQRL